MATVFCLGDELQLFYHELNSSALHSFIIDTADGKTFLKALDDKLFSLLSWHCRRF